MIRHDPRPVIQDTIRVECPKCAADQLMPCEGRSMGVSFHAARHDLFYERFIGNGYILSLYGEGVSAPAMKRLKAAMA